MIESSHKKGGNSVKTGAKWYTSRRGRIILCAVAILLVLSLLAPYPVAGVIYESIFHRRFQPDDF